MSIVKVVGTGRGVSADRRTLFVGPRIPQDIKDMSKKISQIDKKIFRKMLAKIVEGATTPSSADDNTDPSKGDTDILTPEKDLETRINRVQIDFHDLSTSTDPEVNEETLQVIYGDFKEDLADLNIPADFITDLESVVFGAPRTRLETSMLDSRPSLPKLSTLRWRVDTTILTSVLSRVLKPSVLMEMTLSNGNIHTFEVPIAKFQELRYNVSYVIKEMENLEKKSILRLAD